MLYYPFNAQARVNQISQGHYYAGSGKGQADWNVDLAIGAVLG